MIAASAEIVDIQKNSDKFLKILSVSPVESIDSAGKIRQNAIATVNQADCLVSLNFRHIVNANRIPRYNAVNVLLGYSMIDILSPSMVIYD